jgi:hypothetical protein
VKVAQRRCGSGVSRDGPRARLRSSSRHRIAAGASIVGAAGEPVGCAARTRTTAMPLRPSARCARRTLHRSPVAAGTTIKAAAGGRSQNAFSCSGETDNPETLKPPAGAAFTVTRLTRFFSASLRLCVRFFKMSHAEAQRRRDGDPRRLRLTH